MVNLFHPNAIAYVAEARLGRRSGFTSRDGTAEATGLPDGSVALVVAGGVTSIPAAMAVADGGCRDFTACAQAVLYQRRHQGGDEVP